MTFSTFIPRSYCYVLVCFATIVSGCAVREEADFDVAAPASITPEVIERLSLTPLDLQLMCRKRF